MFGSFGKLLAKFKASEALQNGNQPSDPSTSEFHHDGRDVDRANPEQLTNSAARPEDRTNVTLMIEIMKLLARIEYGLDVPQIAESLAISPEDALANCEALDRDALIHHHEGLEEWFIGQRGLLFLQMNGDLDSKT